MGAANAKPRYSGATAGAAVLLDLLPRGWDRIKVRVVTTQWGVRTNANGREAPGRCRCRPIFCIICRTWVCGDAWILSRCSDSALANTGCYLGGGHFDPKLPGRRWLQRGGVSSESLLHSLTPDIISRMNISLANNE